MFRDAYKQRRCIVPIDNFFEWKAIKGAKAKQPYAIAMQSGEPFGLAGIWENWKRPAPRSGCARSASSRRPANELVARNTRPHAGDLAARAMTDGSLISNPIRAICWCRIRQS